jgi:signal transduction histidine kinase
MHSLLSTKTWREYSALLAPTSSLPETDSQATPVGRSPANEFTALNALIQDRGARWSKQARAIKFDIEFKAIEQERRRVSKELHDESLPLLARLIRSVQAVDNQEATSSLVDELHRTVAAFRDLLGELHPVDLEELGLIPALSNVCKRYVRLTGRCILFAGQSEDCYLTELQQLCLYRAMQTVLQMFADSENDLLLVNYDRKESESIITVRCIDKRVSSAEWLSADKGDFDAFESWCGMAGAKSQIGANQNGTFPFDLIISVSDNQPPRDDILTLIGQLTQVRLRELDTIMALAQEEWANLTNLDCLLLKNLAIEAERKRISEDINKIILPRLSKIIALSEESEDGQVRLDVSQRMEAIVGSVSAVMSELHPRLLAEAGLLSSITTLVERFKRASLIETTIVSSLSTHQIDEIPLEAKFAIYRVTQEALNNIEKHSKATRAVVTVKHSRSQLKICIEDNGKGLQGAKNTLSRGLKNIKERAGAIGAQVAWERAATFDSGTLVTISLSCPSSHAQPAPASSSQLKLAQTSSNQHQLTPRKNTAAKVPQKN